MTENLGQWHPLQRELAGLSSDGHLVIATESAHFIHRTEPDLLLRAVNDVVESVPTVRRFGERASFREPATP